jgi:hypothetical protein
MNVTQFIMKMPAPIFVGEHWACPIRGIGTKCGRGRHCPLQLDPTTLNRSTNVGYVELIKDRNNSYMPTNPIDKPTTYTHMLLHRNPGGFLDVPGMFVHR